MPPSYPVPASPLETEYEIKKSRFIARVRKVVDREEAMAFLDEARVDYPDATHHCWAYLIGNPEAASNAAMNDDGEPSGTAGKPILNVIQHKAIGDIMVIVIRYFGGVKLGAGGLVRAYSAAAEQALAALSVARAEVRVRCRLEADFAQEQPVRHWLDRHGGSVVEILYGQQVTMDVELDLVLRDDLAGFCQARGIRLIDPESDG